MTTIGKLKSMGKNVLGQVIQNGLEAFVIVKEKPLLASPLCKGPWARSSRYIELTAPDDTEVILLPKEKYIKRYHEAWKELQETWPDIRDVGDNKDYGPDFILITPR